MKRKLHSRYASETKLAILAGAQNTYLGSPNTPSINRGATQCDVIPTDLHLHTYRVRGRMHPKLSPFQSRPSPSTGTR